MAVFTFPNPSSLVFPSTGGGGGGITWSTPIDSNITVDTDYTYDLGTTGGGLNNVYAGAVYGPAGDNYVELGDNEVLISSSVGPVTVQVADTEPFQVDTANSATNSGNITLTIGTAGGTQGEIKLLKSGVAPTIGDVWTATNVDGSGYWAAPSGSGATTALDNLTTTNINASLLFDTNNAYTIGDATNTLSEVNTNAVFSNTNMNTYANGEFEFYSQSEIFNFYSNGNTNQMSVRYWEPSDTYYVGLLAPDTMTASYNLKLPDADGTSGQVLSTDGAGNLSFISAGGGGATTALDNLVSTNINTNLHFDADATWEVGSGAANLANVHVRNVYSNGTLILDASAGELALSASDEVLALYSRAGGVAASLKLFDKSSSFSAALKSPDTLTASYTLTMPPNDGAANQVLTTDGSGVLSWTTPSASPSFPLLAPDGSASAPSYSFSASTDTGIFASGADLGFVADGTIIAGLATGGGTPSFKPGTNNFLDLGSANEAFKITYTKNAFIRYGELRFYDADYSNYVSLYPAATLASNLILQLPTTQGTAGTMLQTDGAGVLSFSGQASQFYKASSDPGSPAAGQVYYNTTSNKLKVYTGSAWETITSA